MSELSSVTVTALGYTREPIAYIYALMLFLGLLSWALVKLRQAFGGHRWAR